MAVRKHIINSIGEGETLPVLARYEILDRIQAIDTGETTARNQALVSYLYLTGCRVSEACKLIQEANPQRNKFERKQKGRPLMKKQFEFEENLIVVHNVRCLKRNKPIIRNIPILLTDKEQPFMEFLKAYLDTLEDDDYLFNLTRQMAYKILENS